MLELVDTNRGRPVRRDEQFEIRHDSPPGGEIVEIQDLDPFPFGTGGQERAFADSACSGQNHDGFVAEQLGQDGLEVASDQLPFGRGAPLIGDPRVSR